MAAEQAGDGAIAGAVFVGFAVAVMGLVGARMLAHRRARSVKAGKAGADAAGAIKPEGGSNSWLKRKMPLSSTAPPPSAALAAGAGAGGDDLVISGVNPLVALSAHTPTAAASVPQPARKKGFTTLAKASARAVTSTAPATAITVPVPVEEQPFAGANPMYAPATATADADTAATAADSKEQPSATAAAETAPVDSAVAEAVPVEAPAAAPAAAEAAAPAEVPATPVQPRNSQTLVLLSPDGDILEPVVNPMRVTEVVAAVKATAPRSAWSNAEEAAATDKEAVADTAQQP